jgi:hypothetical protein
MRYIPLYALALLIIASCSAPPKKVVAVKPLENDTLAISEDSLLTLVQYQTFQYFWDNAETTFWVRKRAYAHGQHLSG